MNISVGLSGLGWRQKTALYFCFFISGMAGLIYEVLWEKFLALYVGGQGWLIPVPIGAKKTVVFTEL